MCRKILILTCCLLLFGCFAYRPSIQQGNLLTEKMCNQIHRGMTKSQVEHILGTPVLKNTFSKQRVNYVYTFKPGHGKQTEKFMSLTFKHNKIVNIEKNSSN